MDEFNNRLVVEFSVAAMFAFFFLSGWITGNSFIRFPWKTERMSSPIFYWLGQILSLLGSGLFFTWAMMDLYDHGYFAKLLG